jgi:tetratricopeptide (TPR) repeat protein
MNPQSSIRGDGQSASSSRNIVNRSSPTSVVEEQCLELVNVENKQSVDRTVLSETCADFLAELLRERDKRPRITILPTITELPSFEEQDEPDGNSTHFSLILAHDDLSSHMRTLSKPVQHNFGYDEVEKLCDAAATCASTGNEEKAIALYKDGLRMLRHGVRRISKEMETAAIKPKLEKTALFIVLHEEWTEVALIIAKTRTMMAIMYERQGDYEKAICCCEEARAVYQRQASFDERHNKDSSDAQEKANAMDHMVMKIEEARESSPARKTLHETAQRIYEKIEATSDETSLDFLFEDLFDKLTTALTLEILHLGETHPQVADTQAFLSVLFHQRGLIERAEKLMAHSVAVCELALGNSHPRTGLRYRQAGKMFENIGGKENIVTAIELYEKAISTLRVAHGDYSDTLCSVLNDVGILYMRQKDLDTAVKKLIEATDMCYVSTAEGIEERQSTDLIQIWMNLTECYALRKEPDLATHAARSALSVQKDLRAKFDANHDAGVSMPFLLSNVSIASTLKRLGNSLANQKKFDLSYCALLEALSILQTEYSIAQEAAKSNPAIDLARHQDEVASALYSIAAVKQSDERYAEAIRLYQESLQLRVASDRMRVTNAATKSNHVHCAMCLAGVGSIQLAKGDASEAFKQFNQAIHHVRKQGLPDSHPIPKMLWEKSHVAAAKMRERESSFAAFYIAASTGKEQGTEGTGSCISVESHLNNQPPKLDDVKVDKGSTESTNCIQEIQRELRRKGWQSTRFPKRRNTRAEF